MKSALFAAAVAAALLPAAAARSAVLPMTDAMAVSDLVNARLHTDELDTSMIAEMPYAIVYWKGGPGHAAGSALCKKSNGNWAVVAFGSTSLKNAGTLEHLGVPPQKAKALVADLVRAGQ
ncbi:MAG TPA: hypothetical protein VMH02_13255 [Verrucomicrobiae bacterium]|nr:hypothetical protein [Verrucomicrobiae bacterium]